MLEDNPKASNQWNILNVGFRYNIYIIPPHEKNSMENNSNIILYMVNLYSFI